MFRTTLLVAAFCVSAWPALAQSQDAIQQLLANFDRIDVNGDGVISRAEFHKVRAERWTHIDRNGDGYLREDDFPRWAAHRARTQLAEIAFLDENNDGRISKDEFLNGPAPLFMWADQSSDGVLTRSELEVRAP